MYRKYIEYECSLLPSADRIPRKCATPVLELYSTFQDIGMDKIKFIEKIKIQLPPVAKLSGTYFK